MIKSHVCWYLLILAGRQAGYQPSDPLREHCTRLVSQVGFSAWRKHLTSRKTRYRLSAFQERLRDLHQVYRLDNKAKIIIGFYMITIQASTPTGQFR